MKLKSLLAGASVALMATAASAEGKLSIYHWFEYIPQELLDKFTAETGIEVTMDTYDSNEAMLEVPARFLSQTILSRSSLNRSSAMRIMDRALRK